MAGDMRQWIRRCQLIVAGADGNGLDLSSLRIKFNIRKDDAQTPNKARITVYGVSDETVARIKNEFVDISLEAGYQENYGLIFRGNIVQVRSGRENGVDTFMEIAAGDGDSDYVYGTVNKTLAAGARTNDVVNAAMIGQPGYVPDLGGPKLPRGKVLYGMKRDVLRNASQSTDTTWSTQDGKTQFLGLTEVLPGQAVVLNSRTGLIGTPEQTTDGIEAVALLNPMLKIGGRVLIDEKDVASIKLKSQEKLDKKQAEGKKLDKEPAKIASDGQYRILKIEHDGDTRAQAWYSKITCLDIDASAPAKSKVKK